MLQLAALIFVCCFIATTFLSFVFILIALILSCFKPYITLSAAITILYTKPMFVPLWLICAWIAYYVYSTNRNAYQKMGYSKAPFWSDQSTRMLVSSSDYDSLFHACLKSLDSIRNGCKTITPHKENGVIQAISNGTPQVTKGERIEIVINKNSNNYEVEIKSRVRILLRMIDNAKNLENLNNISTYLKQNCPVVEGEKEPLSANV